MSIINCSTGEKIFVSHSVLLVAFTYIWIVKISATKTSKNEIPYLFFSLLMIASGLNAHDAILEKDVMTEEEKIRIYKQMQAEREKIVGSSSGYQTFDFDDSLDEVLNVGTFTIAPMATVSATVAAGITSSGNVVGFTFEGTVEGISGPGKNASDMKMTITSPAGRTFEVGGFSNRAKNDWEFQGLPSIYDGTYSSTHLVDDNGDPVFAPDGTPDEGDWVLEFVYDLVSYPPPTDEMDWSDVTITLHKVEPPPVPLNGTYLVFSLLLMTVFVVYRFQR